MVTEVGAAISDWDRDGRMWWLAGKTLQDGRTHCVFVLSISFTSKIREHDAGA